MAVIDSDAHVLETDHTWDYMLESEREIRPRVVATPGDATSGGESWLVDGTYIGKARNVGYSDTTRESREMEDIQARLKHMDDLDVDVQVLYPTIFLRPFTRRPEVELAVTRSYNRWLIDIWKKAPQRLRWVAVLPLFSMDKAIEEARFAKENGACGIFMRGLIDDKRLSHSYFFPLYAAAEKAGLPICVHASTGSFDWVQLFDGENGFMRFKVPVLSAFHSIVHDGVAAKFAKLRFGFVEVRAQWVPYLAVEIARRLERADNFVARSLIRDNHVYVACQTDDDLPYVLKYAGEDNIVIGSDYGHNDTSSEIEALRTIKNKGEVEPRIIDKILYDNAKALYGI